MSEGIVDAMTPLRVEKMVNEKIDALFNVYYILTERDVCNGEISEIFLSPAS